MIVSDLIGRSIILEDMENHNDEMSSNTSDIILQALHSGNSYLTMDWLISQLDNRLPGIYLNPSDYDVKKTIVQILQKNPLIRHVTSQGRIEFKKHGEIGGHPGEETEKEQEKQKSKVQKSALKNVRSGEL